MPFTYQPASTDLTTKTISKVRLFIKDTKAESPQFQDDEIRVFIDDEGGADAPSVAKAAASLALLVIASDDARLQKRIKTLTLEIDGPALAKELRANAQEFRKQADKEIEKAEEVDDDEEELFDVAEMSADPFAASEHFFGDC